MDLIFWTETKQNYLLTTLGSPCPTLCMLAKGCMICLRDFFLQGGSVVLINLRPKSQDPFLGRPFEVSLVRGVALCTFKGCLTLSSPGELLERVGKAIIEHRVWRPLSVTLIEQKSHCPPRVSASHCAKKGKRKMSKGYSC